MRMRMFYSTRRVDPVPLAGRRHLAVLALTLLIAATAGCGGKPPDPKDYVSRLAAEREAKNTQFIEEDEPVPKSRKDELLPLAYFPIEPDYNVPAVLKPAPEETVVLMPTSTGATRRSRIVGTMEFVLKGQPHKLIATVDAEASNLDLLTVMFSDLTSGTETYPAGRYIEFQRNATGIYELDFNRAFHPYCYYNESYDCPYPPAENRMKIPIRAGERLKE
jgi:uncharacterized protein (DUF1684 family)